VKLFGFDITRRKDLSPPDRGRWVTIHDPTTGAWQQDEPIQIDSVLTFSAVFACARLIASDIGKLRIMLMQRTASGVWKEGESALFSPVLKKPNPVQTRIKFLESWVLSKLLFGNFYGLKERDARGIVRGIWPLDPQKVTPLVSESGQVFYRLNYDRMIQQQAQITVPATEVIHDVYLAPEHPLIGVSPIAACGLTAMQGIKIQRNSEKFFGNMARPSGHLTAPGFIKDETAKRIQTNFQANYGGDNIGKLLVTGDGLKFEQFTMSATDAQLIEQLRWTSEDVCRAFGVPGYKIGVGQLPAYNNIGPMDQAYYSGTLQELIECIELQLDEGLALPEQYRTELEVQEGLLRMDTAARFDSYEKALRSGWKSPNEVRILEGHEPVEGGEEPIMQQQNWPLSVLAKRDPPDTAPPAPAPTEEPEPEAIEEATRAALIKELENADYRA
jgi:HK97 family phage portal protein